MKTPMKWILTLRLDENQIQPQDLTQALIMLWLVGILFIFHADQEKMQTATCDLRTRKLIRHFETMTERKESRLKAKF